MKRMALLTALVLAMALAVPASAATWRNVGQVKAQALAATNNYAIASFYTGMRKVEDVQVGLRSGAAMRADWYGYWACYNTDGAATSRHREGRVKLEPGKWTWITLRNSSSTWDYCEFHMRATGNAYRDLTMKVRVR